MACKKIQILSETVYYVDVFIPMRSTKITRISSWMMSKVTLFYILTSLFAENKEILYRHLIQQKKP